MKIGIFIDSIDFNSPRMILKKFGLVQLCDFSSFIIVFLVNFL